MSSLLYLFSVFVAAVFYKAIANLYFLWRVRVLRKIQNDFIEEHGKPEGAPTWDFVLRKNEVTKIFERAHIEDSSVTLSEGVGHGHFKTEAASVFSNIATADLRFALRVRQMFYEAEGVFRDRVVESISPIYWIETVLFLPAKITEYMGIPPGNLVGRIANAITWTITVLGFAFNLPGFTAIKDEFSLWLAAVVTAVTGAGS